MLSKETLYKFDGFSSWKIDFDVENFPDWFKSKFSCEREVENFPRKKSLLLGLKIKSLNPPPMLLWRVYLVFSSTHTFFNV